MLPHDLKHLFKLSSEIHRYETSSSSKQLLHIPEIHTVSYGNKSLKYHCPLIWNKLIKNNIPIDNKLENNIKIENIKSKNIFKQVLKKHFFYTYTLD